MKKFQPFYYIIILTSLFILAGLAVYTIQMLPGTETSETTIEPQGENQGEALYDLWFSSVKVYDLSVDHALNRILFSADNNTISLLDRDRKLLWDETFSTAPSQAKLSSCGSYAVVGTAGGRIHFTSTDQSYSWDNEGDPVEHIALSPTASWIAAARSEPAYNNHHIDLFNRDGELIWTVETGPIVNLFLSSEYLEQANVFYTYLEQEEPAIAAVNMDGSELWHYQGQSLAAVSKDGNHLAAVAGNKLIVYDSLGYTLWENELPFEPEAVVFNPQNYNRLLVYGKREGVGENLYYFDLAEDLLWMKRIPDGSLIAFTVGGQHIVTASWQHYREDYTQMILMGQDGNEINSWEVAMRVNKLTISGHPYLVVVCGEDGYIDLIDLRPLLNNNGGEGTATAPVYNPVRTAPRNGESRVTLYFIDENTNLVPVSRSVGTTDNPYQTALDELIRGPSRGSALYRTIPGKNIDIETLFDPASGRLTLDMAPELAQMSGLAQSTAALDSILYTIGAFPEIKEVYLTMDSQALAVFGEGITLNQPLEPKRRQSPVYIPVTSGNRYYLINGEGASEDGSSPALASLVEQSLQACRSLSFVSSDLILNDLEVSPEKVQIDVNSALQDLFPAGNGEQQRLRVTLVLDALFMTVFANTDTQRVEITVSGERWIPPAGYPSLTRFYGQPFFVNPEP
ncbi:MAG: GerMN domain-containing protein [Bacillota bacterium]|nr:GerMN domain-containing protein [Bacillota bacterium]